VNRPPFAVASAYGAGAPSTRVRLYEWLEHLGLDAKRYAYAGLDSNSPRNLARRPRSVLAAERRTRTLPAIIGSRRLVLSREASPFGWGAIESALLRAAELGVYDLDDALFADRSGWRAALGKEQKCRRALVAADQVIVGNDFLAEYAVKYAREVVVIPTCVEPADYQVRDDHVISERPRIVWLGSPSTEAYLVGIARALREVRRRTGAEVLVISGARGTERPELDGLITRVPWRSDTFARHLASAHLAIGPLTDDTYARGKCAYKLLQYGAASLPVIASPVGANALALERFGAWAASTTDEWVDQLLYVISLSAIDRAHAGALARKAVEEHYSFGAWAPAWKEAVGL
jgi:glycosyltransferase involved in cell wall biosynthesis